METNNLILKYSSSPHIKTPRTTRSIMINVCIALLPACIAGCIFFGWLALAILALSVCSAFLSEFVFLLILKKKPKEILKQFDFSSIVTGLLVGMCLGTNAPLYVPVFASMFAIVVVKMLFGGTGKNIVNPAIAGRVFAFISFSAIYTSDWALPYSTGVVTSGATVLADTLANGNLAMSGERFWQLFSGVGLAGCIGETCKLAIIIGVIYLAIRKIIDIRYPIIYIVVCGLFTCALKADINYFVPSVFSGGLILGACFMATDYVTTPNTKLGNYIYFICLGLLTGGLRVATKTEVTSFAILLMNLIVPLIDKFVISKPFGFVKKKKEAKK